MERIDGPEGLAAARKDGKGAVRGSDAALHAPSCSRLDAMVTGEGAEGLRLYKGLAAARKAEPGIGVCGECDPDGEEIRGALNRSGAFLHAAVIRDLKNMGFDIRPEMPVTVAPFLSDPSKQPGATSLRMPPGAGHVRLTNKTAFQGAVAASQDSSQRRDRMIDIYASRSHGAFIYTAVIEVKRLDPAYVSWVFLTRDRPLHDYSIVVKSNKLDAESLQLMNVPRSGVEHGDLYVQRKKIWAPPDSINAVVDHGMVVTYDPGSGYGHRGTSLHDATNQVLEGMFGLIVDTVTHQTTAGVAGVPVYYAPIIVTTANLLVYDYDPGAPVGGPLDAPDGHLKRADAVVYHCPHPARVRFPDQIVATRNAAQVELATSWPVVVATAKGLEGLLQGPRLFHGAANAF